MPVDRCSSFYFFFYRISLLFTFGRGTLSWSSVYPEKGEDLDGILIRNIEFHLFKKNS